MAYFLYIIYSEINLKIFVTNVDVVNPLVINLSIFN